MVNMIVAGGNGLLKTLSKAIHELGIDTRTKAYELKIEVNNARKNIFEIPFSDYAVSQGRQEADYDTLNMNASGAASNWYIARDLALVNLHGKMPADGIEAIVDTKFETDDQSEVGMPSYKVRVYGTGLKLIPEYKIPIIPIPVLNL